RFDVVRLTGAFRPVSRGFLPLIGGLSRTRRSGRIVTWDFPVQPSKVAVPKYVEGEGFIISGTLDLEIDRLRHRLAPLLDLDRHLNGLQMRLGDGRHFRAGRGAKLDRKRPSVERVPLPDQDDGITPSADPP